jgi:hypothetical protein
MDTNNETLEKAFNEIIDVFEKHDIPIGDGTRVMISILEVIQVSFNIPPEEFWGEVKTEGLRLSTLRVNNEH